MPVILICDQGYQSSLAAAVLRGFDLDAGDVIGGVEEWKSEALPLGLPAAEESPDPVDE